MRDATYERKGMVSVFLGTVRTKAFLDGYLREDYAGSRATSRWWVELGIPWFDHDFQDAFVAERGQQDVEVFLQHPFSYIESFRTPLLEACRQQGLSSVNAGVLMYDFDYSTAGKSPQLLRFVASLPYVVEHPEWMQELLR